jgi:hypothetical protein
MMLGDRRFNLRYLDAFSAQYHLLSLTFLLFTFYLGACTNGEVVSGCVKNEDCADHQLCINRKCSEKIIVVTVQCQDSTQCAENQRCVNGECFNNECQEGESRECRNQCGTGTQLCSGGVWRSCSAQANFEICGNQKDEDCDGKADEQCGNCQENQERPCGTPECPGLELCTNGQYQGCTARTPRIEVCGNRIDEDCDGTPDEQCDACDIGTSRACQTECGMGTESCVYSYYQDCTAPQPKEEACNGIDEDCDGNVDENLSRSCQNLCGIGSESCQNGVWQGCTAPSTCACDGSIPIDRQVCGTCGFKERSCQNMSWGEWGSCQEVQGNCVPGDQENGRCEFCGIKVRSCHVSCDWGEWSTCLGQGACEAGSIEQEECPGGCGTRTRSCQEDCSWGEWSICMGGGGECGIGDQQESDCGYCGTKTRTCIEGCIWGEWSECGGEGVCMPNDKQSDPCDGACSFRERSCNAQCQWGAWGMCNNQAQCDDGAIETRACGQCGSQQRACNGCAWGDWALCLGEGICTAGESKRVSCGSNTGACQAGLKTQVCNDQCAWEDASSCEGEIRAVAEVCGNNEDENCDGTVERAPDQYENNNSCGQCRLINPADPNTSLNATIDSYLDTKDYYCFDAIDNFNVVFFEEKIILSLTNIPNGKDYDLVLYRNLSDCNADRPLASSDNPRGQNEAIEWKEDIINDDAGRYYILVKPYNNTYFQCYQNYTLSINGLN